MTGIHAIQFFLIRMTFTSRSWLNLASSLRNDGEKHENQNVSRKKNVHTNIANTKIKMCQEIIYKDSFFSANRAKLEWKYLGNCWELLWQKCDKYIVTLYAT